MTAPQHDPAVLDAIARWCAGVPGLHRAADAYWQAELLSRISYPDSGHAALADLEPGSYWFAHRNDVIAAVIANHPPAGPVFDVGGGNGFVSLGLNRAGLASVVIEPGAGGARVAQARGLPVIQAAFQDLQIPPATIPAAGMFDVLEHIEDDRGALAALHRALTPGGMLYFTVPAHQALWSSEDDYAGHFRRYTLNGLARRVREAGFEPVFASYFFFALVLPILLLRAAPYRLGGNRGAVGDPEKQHALPDNAAGKAIRWTFARELARVKAGRPVPFGASCILACRKT